MKTYTLSFLFLIIGLALAKAQVPTNKSGTAISDNVEGTYQIQVSGRDNPYIPANLAEVILKNRHKTETIYIQLGTLVRLMILAESEIKKTNFKPLPQIAHLDN